MPSPKSKEGSAAVRYRPAANYDDATLAQKREYWRTKKREQRARLSERRGGRPPGGPAPADSSGSAGSPAPVSPAPSHDASRATVAAGSPASQSSSPDQNQKPKWIHTMKPCLVLPQPPPFSSQGRAAGGSLTRAGPSPGQSPSSVPPVRATRFTNGSSAPASPQPHVSMQAAPPLPHQATPSPNHAPPRKARGSSPHPPISIKAQGQEKDRAEPQGGRQSAAAAAGQKVQGAAESEEERAARRRELWRVKKREQRAKMAARAAKTKRAAQRTELTGPRALLPAQRTCPALVKVTFASARKENGKLAAGGGASGGGAAVASVNIQVQDGTRKPQRGVTPDAPAGKRSAEPPRRLPGYAGFSGAGRGPVRCRTPRQRLAEVQKSLLNPRSVRIKTPLLLSVMGHSRNVPRPDSRDTPEQILAKRREYWRVKKREQRAKLSLEVKARLKEKDSVTRRVRRYQAILEEMRRSRTGGALSHASETIGGFIKEDGTVTIKVPKGPDRTAGDLLGSRGPLSQHRLRTKPRGLLCPAQVKVSVPLAGLSNRRLPKVLPARTRTARESTTLSSRLPAPGGAGGQLTLSQPPQSAASSGPSGGCVMKMAVSGGAAALTLSLDPGLTEEERMAKKREYWRVKKREQRAARAARLKQGGVRAGAALQRRRASGNQGRRGAAAPTRTARAPAEPHANEIKQEAEPAPSVDLPGPASPPPPASQPEPDPATTLLAVASMKKLLEESLSSVREGKGQEAEVKTEAEEAAPPCEVKAEVPALFLEEDSAAPLASANLTLHIKSWQSDSEDLALSGSPSPAPLSSPPREAPPLPTSTCDHASQTNPTFTLVPSADTAAGPPPPWLRTKQEEEEPPRLHHLPLDHLPSAPEVQEQQQQQDRKWPPAPRGQTGAGDGMSSLQRKREYWKLMKRQQRARLKARQRERPGGGGGATRLLTTSMQARGAVAIGGVRSLNHQARPALRSKPPAASPASRTPPAPVPDPARQPQPPPPALHVKVPVDRTSSSAGCGRGRPEVTSSPTGSTCADRRRAVTRSQRWTSGGAEVDSAQALPTLEPPENPLSSIDLQPMEPPLQTPDPPIGTPPRLQVAPPLLQAPVKAAAAPPSSSVAPPKPIRGESEEDFLKRKREYWRVKKKEQRARKAIQDGGGASRRTACGWRPLLPAPDTPAQDSGPWTGSADQAQLLMSACADSEQGACPFYPAPAEDDPELLFPDYEGGGVGEESSLSDSAAWRSRYLMDYDPLNQLLVCVVCGELQYSHSLEAARAHIDDAHPHTLGLEAAERRRILDAWDEQVSRRERFFTSQLQQHSGT